ncbi:uncharacterized protein LOC134216782 [Armigeres subalbatus]|uniref:uncharacterized protein LOC134216782 n=1 Tax=Armigeres subalbatus TaxID=124917 RepID=UPI002ED103A3
MALRPGMTLTVRNVNGLTLRSENSPVAVIVVLNFHLLQNLFLHTIRVDVDIVDLFDFAEKSRRNWIEGNQLFKNNHVLIAGATKIKGSQIHIFCSCLRGSNPSEPPRQVNIVTSTNFKDWQIHCSCPAGNHHCKHKFACLLYIHTTKELEVLSATDIRQQWGKVAKVQSETMYSPVPLSGLCNQRSKPAGANISDDLCNSILQLFITELPASALAKSFKGRNVLARNDQQDEELVQHVVPAEGTGKDISHIPLPSWNSQRPPQKSTKENNSEEKDHVAPLFHDGPQYMW